jgi:hypothetical protein
MPCILQIHSLLICFVLIYTVRCNLSSRSQVGRLAAARGRTLAILLDLDLGGTVHDEVWAGTYLAMQGIDLVW